MPTARPIMEMMFSTKVLIVWTWPIKAVKASARMMLITARPMGMKAASTAPNTNNNTSRAAGTPRISARLRSDLARSMDMRPMLASPVWASVKPLPAPASTTACSLSALSIAWSGSPAIATVMSVACLSRETRVGSPLW